jgi:hypothetical protein
MALEPCAPPNGLRPPGQLWPPVSVTQRLARAPLRQAS